MMVTIPADKLRDTLVLMVEWSRKSRANSHELRGFLGKLFHVAQCSHPAWLFVNHILAMLLACPI